MSKDPKNERGDQDVSRRRLLKKAALAVGAATSMVAARSALARPSDVMIDSAGRVLIDGAALSVPRPEGSFETAASSNDQCVNDYNCTGGSNKGCANRKDCVAPLRAGQPAGSAKVNAPLGGAVSKKDAPLRK
jgi:hypothetical protein